MRRSYCYCWRPTNPELKWRTGAVATPGLFTVVSSALNVGSPPADQKMVGGPLPSSVNVHLHRHRLARSSCP